MGKQYRKTQDQLVNDLRGTAAKQGAATEEELGLARQNAAVQAGERAKAEPFVSSLEATRPSGMNAYTAATYGAEQDKINQIYRNLRESGLKVLAQRGYGRAPSGMVNSLVASTGNAQAGAETQNFRDALARTEGEKFQALDYRKGLQSLYNPVPAYSVGNQGRGVQGQLSGAASGANVARSSMGSTFGDVMGGISTIAGAVVPGAQGLGMLKNLRGPVSSISPSQQGWWNAGNAGPVR